MLTGEQLTRLIDAGATPDQLKVFGQILDESVMFIRNEKHNVVIDRYGAKRSYGALRQKRYRENKKIKQIQNPCVTDNVTSVTSRVTVKPIYIEDTFLLTSEVKKESKKDIILNKMSFVTLPEDWRKWAMDEFGWPLEITQDTWQLFFEYWVNGKGRSTKREKWGATWRTWCRTQAQRVKPINGAKNGYHQAPAEDLTTRMNRIAEKQKAGLA